MTQNFTLRLVPATTEQHLATIRELFREYEESIGVDICFQGFEKELEGLPGDYAPPAGRLYIAYDGEKPAGCIALRKIGEGVCEMKRLYVRPLARGKGVGRRLAVKLIGDARELGYKHMRLDTLPSMKRAQELYLALGFKSISPYRANSIEGVVYMELALD